ncbi:prephenate dehydrogenase [Anaerosphaera multitolerans]|uniref:Prephenate dehydrogenase n=1 Tax=Anaerosphaera multitolerans TaxID=2487351 RepID=A0A437S673_9FIRM|nr:prephenate dehydrogenase [Anaerosphaera multitolerans]RVU54499.1 prephenate dehydrogenase [Anaerosphaera multitolerans]
MKVGVVGLGLIGGSIAKRFRELGKEVFGFDSDRTILDFVKLSGDIDDELTDDKIGKCDYIFLAISPDESIDWLRENSKNLNSKTVVIDCCGTKRKICKEGFEKAAQYGFTFIGGHPMAGNHKGGFKNSSGDLFKGASMVLVFKERKDFKLMVEVKTTLEELGFLKIIVSSAEEHDEIIAYTSQMPHLVSNAFVKSKTALISDRLISGGSFRDFTRVAYLDEDMWTELFMENKDNLKYELDILIEELNRYRSAIEAGDETNLRDLLAEGKNRKVEVEKYGTGTLGK